MKNIIFDMDGVLINSEPLITSAAKQALIEGGISAEISDFKPYIGSGEEKFIIGLCTKNNKPELIDELTLRMYDLYDKCVYKDLMIYDGAPQLIKELIARGHTLALVSSAAERKLNISLDAARIDKSAFKVVLTGDDVTEKKPSPEPYLKAADKLKVAPKDCIVIEDAMNGIRSAKTAGMTCIAVASSFSRRQIKLSAPDYIVDKVYNTLEIIERL